MVEAELDWREWTDSHSNKREAVTFKARQVLFEPRTVGATEVGSQQEGCTPVEVAVAAGGSAPASEGEASADDLPS